MNTSVDDGAIGKRIYIRPRKKELRNRHDRRDLEMVERDAAHERLPIMAAVRIHGVKTLVEQAFEVDRGRLGGEEREGDGVR